MKNAEEYFHILGKSLDKSKLGNMFGWRCYKIGRKPYVFFDENTENGMVFKLEKSEIKNAITDYGAKVFNPGGRGKPMKNWVVVNFKYHDVWEEFLHLSYQYLIEEIENGK
ncbi:MAG: hypothetical protein AAFN93_09165 [Bacteroidota bacterium]